MKLMKQKQTTNSGKETQDGFNSNFKYNIFFVVSNISEIYIIYLLYEIYIYLLGEKVNKTHILIPNNNTLYASIKVK